MLLLFLLLSYDIIGTKINSFKCFQPEGCFGESFRISERSPVLVEWTLSVWWQCCSVVWQHGWMFPSYYEGNGSKSRQILPSPFFLSSHWVQGNETFSWLPKLVTSTFSSIHPAPKPLLSCSMRKRVSWPRSRASILKSSICPLSNKLTNFLVSGLCPVSPLAPYKVINTLASVPACATSAV